MAKNPKTFSDRMLTEALCDYINEQAEGLCEFLLDRFKIDDDAILGARVYSYDGKKRLAIIFNRLSQDGSVKSEREYIMTVDTPRSSASGG